MLISVGFYNILPPKMNTCLDVVGLQASTNGRSCDNHAVCGQEVGLKEDMVITFHGVPTVINGRHGRGIGVFLMQNEKKTCCVGFLPKAMAKKEAELEGVRARIVQLMSADKTETPIASDRELHYRNLGSCRVKCITPWNTKKGKKRSAKPDNQEEPKQENNTTTTLKKSKLN